LSLRSPKDILENKVKIKERDHRTVKIEKKRKQLDILKVKNIEEILFLLKKSKRIQEDLLLIKDEDLFLVFQPWRPSIGQYIEYRCFINFNKLVGICLYKPEYYSTLTSIPVALIQHYIEQLLNIITYPKCAIDVFIKDNKVYFIEINPFDEFTDTFSFDFDEINSTEHLICKL
jgi:hypothetical protein